LFFVQDPSKRIEVETRRNADCMLVGKVVLPVSPSYQQKLEQLYKKYGSASGEGLDAVLAVVLMRYDALKGSVFQARLPPGVMSVLKRDFGVFMECFASPLSCYFPRYCSMFSDDFAFGSVGSFFQFRPLDGSFVAFPPLVSSVVIAAVRHIEDLLIGSNRALSFLVVVHGNVTDDSPIMQTALSSKFLVHRQAFAAKEHVLTDGQAFRKATLLKLALAPTSFVFLQNEAGTKRWPPNETTKTERLKRVFAGKRDEEEEQKEKVIEEQAVAQVVEEPVSSNWKSLKKKIKAADKEKKTTTKTKKQ
jgi:hypothetical protein